MDDDLLNLYKDAQPRIATEPENDQNAKCMLCYSKTRLSDFRRLKPGNHICMAGEKIQFNLGDKLVHAYTHHAIVTKVECVSGGTATVSLVHFYTTPFDKTIQIQETTELLDMYYHEIYVITYRHFTHTPDEIVYNARSFIDKHAKYSLFSCNCENFCNVCCVGNPGSTQIRDTTDMFRDIVAALGNISTKVIKGICMLLQVSIDDLSSLLYETFDVVPWVVLGLTSLLFVVYTIWKHRRLKKQRKKGSICSLCYRRSVQKLWIRFGTHVVLQVGGLGLVRAIVLACATKGIAIGAISVCCILALVITKLVPTFSRVFFSPFHGSRIQVRTLKEICIGDVIEFDHLGIAHAGVVSAVNPDKEEVAIIHYSLPKLFGRREVVEETIKLDMKKDRVIIQDYSGHKTHDPEMVVQRARQRVGERKFSLMSNRSCHFCYWAKVDEDIDVNIESVDGPDRLMFIRSIDPFETVHWTKLQEINVDHRRRRKHATKTLGRTWARIRDEIRVGQLVEFKYKGLWHKAVSTSVTFDTDNRSKLSLTVVHYGKRRRVCEDTFEIDLKCEDIWIYTLHPVNRYPKEEVVRRARARIDRGGYNIVNHRASHLANEIVRKDLDRAPEDMDDIKPGDVITYCYWARLHDGVITEVEKRESKGNVLGQVKVVHYTLDHLFAKRTVQEDTMPVDLSTDRIYIKNFRGYLTYPGYTVVKRVRSRIGEQRFSIFGNTSSDLAHWAKVIQSPAVMGIASQEQQELPNAADEKMLIPKSGKEYKAFHINVVHAWSDLNLGMIIEYTYFWIPHKGIVSHIDEQRKQIKIIHYGAANLFATRTITEDTLKLDMRRDTLKIYRPHPAICNKPNTIVQKARAKLGEKDWKRGNRSWDFCLQCVLKPKQNEV